MRAYERVQFFMLHKDKDFIPVWVFKPADAPSGIAGLVCDIGAGGLQILTQQHEMQVGERFEIMFLDETASKNIPGRLIELVWTRPAGSAYAQSGFAFVTHVADLVDKLVQHMAGREQRFLRCMLKSASGRAAQDAGF